jgi:peptide-methionine (R)-S-oxide reductase
MSRRSFLLTGGALALLTGFGASRLAAFSPSAQAFPVAHTEAEWRRLLTPNQYAVLRENATERPFSSPLLEERRPGIFACAGCSLGLFSSETKFDSGAGWPSFWAPLHDESVGTSKDTSLGMTRTKVHCAGCGGHLGHVFEDGPEVTGLRYCINGVAMTFRCGRRARDRRTGSLG